MFIPCIHQRYLNQSSSLIHLLLAFRISVFTSWLVISSICIISILWTFSSQVFLHSTTLHFSFPPTGKSYFYHKKSNKFSTIFHVNINIYTQTGFSIKFGSFKVSVVIWPILKDVKLLIFSFFSDTKISLRGSLVITYIICTEKKENRIDTWIKI